MKNKILIILIAILQVFFTKTVFSQDVEFNASTIEINGRVEADIKSDKVTLGKHASLEGSIISELVVISGNYQGKIKADSVWLTDSSVITGEINYKSLQMDRGAALNCKIIHNWDENKLKNNKQIDD